MVQKTKLRTADSGLTTADGLLVRAFEGFYCEKAIVVVTGLHCYLMRLPFEPTNPFATPHSIKKTTNTDGDDLNIQYLDW